jgi:uncharacterized protein YndB with AHSA1/START domain
VSAIAYRAEVEPKDRVLEITRVFDAPRPAVFASWTDARQLAQWWGPRGFSVMACKADVRVGGSWRVETRSPEGEQHNAGGVYREVAVPERLVFTMAWDGAEDGEPGREALVSVRFAEEGQRTRVTFRQSVFSSTAARDAHDQGWSSAFELLDEYLAGHPRSRASRDSA